jgi:ferredoxin--NADP+ reductase
VGEPSWVAFIPIDLENILDAEKSLPYLVAVIGAGPAGLFAARQLANNGVHVILLNRDVKPGGLAEYGIYYDKYKMKVGLRKQFRQILESPNIEYYGNVVVGGHADLTLDELHKMGFQAVLVTAGAQGTKWLGLPGEDLKGVYHAKDLVYHYNKLPPFSQGEYTIGERVALVGVGNVMMDIAHWVVRDLKVKEVVAVARRGPAEVKFTRAEMENVAANLDIETLDAELARVRPVMEALNQDVTAARDFILSGRAKALPPVSDTLMRFEFLASPAGMVGDENGRVRGLEVENTTLTGNPADPKARSLGTKRIIDVDTVVFCIGDKVDEDFGLPVQWNAFVKNPQPALPVAGLSYEAFDHEKQRAIPGVFVAGWSREASSGLVGLARKDGENGAQAVLQYLKILNTEADPNTLKRLRGRVKALNKPVITTAELRTLEAIEQAEAQRLGLEDFKFGSNEEMFAALGIDIKA